jgi:hypothetical protein
LGSLLSFCPVAADFSFVPYAIFAFRALPHSGDDQFLSGPQFSSVKIFLKKFLCVVPLLHDGTPSRSR